MLNVLLLAVCLLNISCASTFKTKTLAGMALGFTGGYVAGVASAPDGDREAMHGALYGAAASSLVAAGMLYFFDDSREKKQQMKIKLMTEEIHNLKRGKTELSKGTTGLDGQGLPGSLQSLVSPGKWKLYKIDEWVKKGNTLIHQDKELNFEPSRLK